MLDIKEIRKDPQGVETRLKQKDPTVQIAPIIELDEGVRHLKAQAEALKNKRNLLSQEVGKKKKLGEDATEEMDTVRKIGEDLGGIESTLKEKEIGLNDLLYHLPNLPGEDTPVSMNVEDNVQIKSFLEKPIFSFEPKNHIELNELHHLFDFQRAAKVAGSNWSAYCGNGAKLEWALLNYMLDIHQENGFTFWLPPLMVREEIALGSAHLPKFASQLFKVTDEDYNLYLIPTAESSLMGLHHNEIIDEDKLPLRYVAYTPCFRREAGALGGKERGLIRTHQFNKVEMFAYTTAEQSAQMFDAMLTSAQKVLQGLNLHYRVMHLVTGDMSFAASKTFDLEVWLPGQDRYYEVSSISNCGDFQARRSNVRTKARGQKPKLCHTLNGSGLATSRLMVALLENNQRKDGSIEIPLVLHKYLNGMKELKAI